MTLKNIRKEISDIINELDTKTYANLMDKTSDYPWVRYMSNKHTDKRQRWEKEMSVNKSARDGFLKKFYDEFPEKSPLTNITTNQGKFSFDGISFNTNYTNYYLNFKKIDDDKMLGTNFRIHPGFGKYFIDNKNITIEDEISHNIINDMLKYNVLTRKDADLRENKQKEYLIIKKINKLKSSLVSINNQLSEFYDIKKYKDVNGEMFNSDEIIGILERNPERHKDFDLKSLTPEETSLFIIRIPEMYNHLDLSKLDLATIEYLNDVILKNDDKLRGEINAVLMRDYDTGLMESKQKEFKFRVKHDKGSVIIKTTGSSMEAARKKVMKAENAPESAVVFIK